MSKATIARHYTRLLSLWPKDPLRPELPFTRTIEYRGQPYGVTPLSPPEPSTKETVKTTSTPATPATPSDPKAELANINALYTLLENRYSKRYPVSPQVLKPTSNPEYYDRLMDELKRATTKSWFQAKLDEWKMKIRWQ